MRELALLLRAAATDSGEIVARNGGDECCVVFADTEKSRAIVRAERLRASRQPPVYALPTANRSRSERIEDWNSDEESEAASGSAPARTTPRIARVGENANRRAMYRARAGFTFARRLARDAYHHDSPRVMEQLARLVP